MLQEFKKMFYFTQNLIFNVKCSMFLIRFKILQATKKPNALGPYFHDFTLLEILNRILSKL